MAAMNVQVAIRDGDGLLSSSENNEEECTIQPLLVPAAETPKTQMSHGLSVVGRLAVVLAVVALGAAPLLLATGTHLRKSAQEPRELFVLRDQNCMQQRYCRDPGLKCFKKNDHWAGCKLSCTPGQIFPEDPKEHRTPWECILLVPPTHHRVPCQRKGQQCGGWGYSGRPCCETGSICIKRSDSWSQCVDTGGDRSGGCTALYGKCGGDSSFSGATCCQTGSYCKYQNRWYSQCVKGHPPGRPVHPTPQPTPGPVCAKLYQKCGADQWYQGPTCCEVGCCRRINQWHHQCDHCVPNGHNGGHGYLVSKAIAVTDGPMQGLCLTSQRSRGSPVTYVKCQPPAHVWLKSEGNQFELWAQISGGSDLELAPAHCSAYQGAPATVQDDCQQFGLQWSDSRIELTEHGRAKGLCLECGHHPSQREVGCAATWQSCSQGSLRFEARHGSMAEAMDHWWSVKGGSR